MVNYLLALITTFLKLHQSTNIEQGLFLCKNIIYPERKCLWVSFFKKYIDPKMWSALPESFKSLSLYSSEKQYKTSCYLAKLPAGFRFIRLSLFCNIVLIPLFSLVSFTCAVAHPTPLYIGIRFSQCFFVLVLFV